MQVADVVIAKGDRVLLVQQRKEIAKGLWSYPGGAIEEGETAEQAVVREVKEELGVELINPRFLKSYLITTAQGELIINTFTGELLGKIVLKDDELMAYGWFSLDELEVKSDLRGKVVIEQARDVLRKNEK